MSSSRTQPPDTTVGVECGPFPLLAIQSLEPFGHRAKLLGSVTFGHTLCATDSRSRGITPLSAQHTPERQDTVAYIGSLKPQSCSTWHLCFCIIDYICSP